MSSFLSEVRDWPNKICLPFPTSFSSISYQYFLPEITLCQSGHAGPALDSDRRLLDVYREKPVRLTVRIAVPVKEHPKVSSLS